MSCYELQAKSGKARAGLLKTAHGVIETPVFMPVGTQATVKSLTPEQVSDIGFRLILGNTYHLMLQPGAEIVQNAGGLHKFMNWPHSILTDSGGFQVMSQSSLREITEEGVEFKSYLDGSKHFLNPELAVSIQEQLGADIIMVLDICTKYPMDQNRAKHFTEITHRWAKRSLEARTRPDQLMFAIVQGGFDLADRAWSADVLTAMDFDGFAVGSLSVGEPLDVAGEILEVVVPRLPQNKPRYLMGVGDPAGIIQGIAEGIDMFDCVLPTRLGRNGAVMTDDGAINITRSKWASDFTPIDEKCSCYTCRNYSKAYLRHLFKSHEMLAATLATIHNIHFLKKVVDGARQAIFDGTFGSYKEKWLEWRISQNDDAVQCDQ